MAAGVMDHMMDRSGKGRNCATAGRRGQIEKLTRTPWERLSARLHQGLRAIGVVWCILALSVSPVHSGEVTVDARIEPILSVFPFQNIVDIGVVSSVGIGASLPFAIESNSDRVNIEVFVTHLYLDADPVRDIYLALDTAYGVELLLTNAVPADGQDANAAYVSSDSLNKPEGIYDGWKTETVTLQSNLPGNMFQQDLTLNMHWSKDADMMPSGSYRGYVILYVMNL